MDNIYYVYEYIRLDNNTVFYVGKGKLNRMIKKKTNQIFLRICDKVDYKYRLIKDNLSEAEALQLEKDIIHDYVYNKGYGICIKGFHCESGKPYLCNMTWGGEGISGFKFSDISKERMSKYRKGKKIHTEESKRKISEAHSGKYVSQDTKNKISMSRIERKVAKGENNPMYGVHRFGDKNPFYGQHHSDETKKKISEALEGKYIGSKNPMYGKLWTEDKKEKIRGVNNGMYGKPSPTRSKTKLIMPDKTEIIFEYNQQLYDYFKNNFGLSSGTVKNLLRTGEPYKTTYSKYKYLVGMRIEKIKQ